MHSKTAVAIAGASVLATVAFTSVAQAQTRWPVSGSFVPPANGAPYGSPNEFWNDYAPPAAYRPEADREKPQRPQRPARAAEFVYIDLEGGYETLSLNSLVARDLRPTSVATSGSGALYGVGGGLRLGFLTLGGRVRGTHLNVGELSTIDGELGVRVNLERFEPRFTFAAGYARLAGRGSELAGIPDLDIHGWNARAGVGLDYYADKNFSVGVNFTGDVLVMARPGVDLSTSPEKQARERVGTCDAITDPAAKEPCVSGVVRDAEGTSTGFAGTMSLVMGLHF